MPSFDPYHLWLGIAPSEQPASYFRLLGLSEEETREDVILAAATRQFQFVRTHVEGPHSAEARRLLQEIVTARNVLRDPQQRSVYLQGLKLASASSARRRIQPPSPAPGDASWIQDEPRPIGAPNLDFNSYDNPFAEQNSDRWQPAEETAETGPIFAEAQTQVDRQLKRKKSAKPSARKRQAPPAFEIDVAPTRRPPKKSNSLVTAVVFIGVNAILAIVYFAYMYSSEPAPAPSPPATALASNDPEPRKTELSESAASPVPTPAPQLPQSPASLPTLRPMPTPEKAEEEFTFPVGRDSRPGSEGATRESEEEENREPVDSPVQPDSPGTEDKEGKERTDKSSVLASLVTRDGKDFIKTAQEELTITDFRRKSQYVWRENLTSTPAGKPVFIEGRMGPTRGTKQDIALMHMGKATPLVAAFDAEKLPAKMKKLTREGRIGWYYGVFIDEPTNASVFDSHRLSSWDEDEVERITFRDVRREFILLVADGAGDPKAMKKLQFNPTYPRENIDVSDPIEVTVTVANDNPMPMVDLVVAVHAHIANNVPAPNNHLGTRVIFIPRIAAKEAVNERVTIHSRASGLIQIQVVPQALHGVPTPE